MQWLLTLETDDDPISNCRLMNIFRRKGVKIVTFSLAPSASGFSVVTLVDTAQSEVEHVYHFLRRTEGVGHVTYYFHATEQDRTSETSYIFINETSNSSGSLAQALDAFPNSKVVFAGQGKYLLEVPADDGMGSDSLAVSRRDELEFFRFVRVKTTRSQPVSELVA